MRIYSPKIRDATQAGFEERLYGLETLLRG